MNRLADASSPYLRQHAENPVEWFEWGDEAFAKAAAEDKPVFLSVGYSSCHWCHVMAHESFEDPDLAAVLNEHFVSVKVDREERPDVDSAYMGAVQALTGRGGWPMSVFTTPDGTPFFGGTYWPPDDRHGMPGFRRVLEAVLDAWRRKREDVLASGRQLAAHLAQAQELGEAAERLDLSIAERAASRCVQLWDDQLGGFGQAPKFPQAMTIDFLLAHHVRTGDEAALRAAGHSLEAMSRGGIYDHVAGGFARYSVDARWLVPHFEKMLYDNALLLRAYVHGALVDPDEQRRLRFRRVARETADYLLRDLRHADGGLYSATDADSEGIEGKYFAWSLAEFQEVISGAGEDPEEWSAFFGVTAEGNFADPHHPEWGRHNVLSEPAPRDEADAAFGGRLERVRQALAERRTTRVPPGLDDKVLTSWNALAIGALAEAGAALGEPRYVAAAQECARFIQSTMVRGGRLLHTWRDGHDASVGAFLEDVAYLAQGLLALYEADHDERWVAWATRLAAQAHSDFAEIRDGAFTGAYHSTAHDAETLVVRPKDLWDNATPAGPSVMVDVGLRLHGLTGDATHRDRAEQTLRLFATRAEQAPTGYGELLRGLERLAAGPREVAIVGDPTEEEAARALVDTYRERWRPAAVLAVGEAQQSPHAVALLSDRPRVDGRPAAYVCRDFACDRPVTSPDDLRTLLDVDATAPRRERQTPGAPSSG